MTKHKISSDKPKEEKPDLIIKEKEIKLVEKVPKSSTDLKSYIQSGSKYVYIVAAAALVSGIFTPFTINADITIIIYGMLTIFLGLAGGILIFLATKYQKFRSIMVCGGLVMMIVSLILIYELSGRSILP